MEKIYLDSEIPGQRIYIKKHDVALAQVMFDYVTEDRERLDKFLPWVEHIKTVQDEIDYINLTHERWDNYTLFDYGIFLKENDLYVGNIGVHSLKWNSNCAEIGY